MKELVSLFAFCSILSAQEFRASLAGRVTDPSGASVAEAAVSVKSVATGLVTSGTTDSEGRYQILFLNPGEYTFTAEKQGFQRNVQEHLNLQTAERATLDIQLKVGDVAQTLTVEANAGVVEVETADRGLTVDSKRVEATPLQGRNVMVLAWTAPGVAVTAAAQRIRPFDTGGSSGMSINGSRNGMNEALVDGVTSLSRASDITFVPQSEATDEVRVQTTSYDAQYGWTTGGVINITTKSGSNELHGSLFEYFQNTHLNANTFNSNRNGIGRQSSHINTFGGTVGGAVIKNKLFFFFGYENIRQVIPDPFVTSVPTAAQRAGDFSQTFGADGRLLTIYDPATTRLDASGNYVRTPFAGNIIPTNRLNPVATNVLSLIPLGNVPGNTVTGLNNLSSSGNTRKFTDFYPEYNGRGDYVFSDATRMFIRYSRNALQEARGFRYSTNESFNVADTSGNSPFTRDNHNAVVQFTHTLNPTTILDIRGGLARFQSQSGYGPAADYDLANLGFSSLYKSQAGAYFPRFSFTNYEGAGSNPVQVSPIAQTTTAQASIYKIIGAHSTKFGGEWRLIRSNSQQPGYAAGNFSFTQQFTGSNPLAVNSTTGNAIASFLLGAPQTGSIDVNTQPARQQHSLSFFVHDDYRVTDKLKLNVGLRWDYQGPLTDRFDALLVGFDRTSPSPLRAPGLDLKGGLQFAGVNGAPNGLYKRDLNNFAPRIGFAYRLNEKTVLRGGYGLMYAQTFNDPGQTPGYSQQTAMVTSVVTGIPENLINNPFPGGILRPVGNSQGLGTYLGQGFSFSNSDRVLPWTHQFSFEIQRELPARVLLTVGYVGSRIRGLSVSKGINEISAESMALGASYLAQNVANPMAGLVPGTSINAATVTRSQLLRPYPQFLSITENNRSEGKSRYDGFQLMVAKRMSAGVSASMSYTYSRTLEWMTYRNAQDSALEKSVTAWDVPHSLQLNGVYELPFGKGKKFFDGAPAGISRLISGWEISGIARLQSGQPVTMGTNTVPTGNNTSYADQNLDRWFNTCPINCQEGELPAWTVRQANTLQTWPSRVTSFRQPGVRNLDAAIMKRTRITESVMLTFRTEFLNATNTPQFYSGLVVDINNSNFGRIAGVTDQSNLPRFIQLSMKLQF